LLFLHGNYQQTLRFLVWDALSDERRLLVGKSEGKRPLGRPRRKWVDNIKVDLVEIEWGGVDWIGLAQDRES
jgi:hypothetical protein